MGDMEDIISEVIIDKFMKKFDVVPESAEDKTNKLAIKTTVRLVTTLLFYVSGIGGATSCKFVLTTLLDIITSSKTFKDVQIKMKAAIENAKEKYLNRNLIMDNPKKETTLDDFIEEFKEPPNLYGN